MGKRILFLLFSFFICQNVFCQNETALCKAVADFDFSMVEKIVKVVIKKNKNGRTYGDAEGSVDQINLTTRFDSISMWFKRQNCVEDAYWDRCQEKVAIYPGHFSIGVKFRTSNGIIEKCFLVQQGTTGQMNILGWKPKIFSSRQILIYKKMYDCKHFIEQQKINCEKRY